MSIKLESKRLILREFVEADKKTAHEYAKIPEVSKYQSWGPNEVSDTDGFISMAIEGQKADPRKAFELAVVEKDTGRHIGGCGIRVKATAHSEADMGYSLHPDVWGKGYGTELVHMILKFGFETIKINRIWALVHTENIASYRILEKNDFVREGTQRQGLFVRGDYVDCYLYAIVKSDFVKKEE